MSYYREEKRYIPKKLSTSSSPQPTSEPCPVILNDRQIRSHRNSLVLRKALTLGINFTGLKWLCRNPHKATDHQIEYLQKLIDST